MEEEERKMQEQYLLSSFQSVKYECFVYNHTAFSVPADLMELYKDKQEVEVSKKEEMIAYLLDQFTEVSTELKQLISEFQKGTYDFWAARGESPENGDFYFLLLTEGKIQITSRNERACFQMLQDAGQF